MVEEEKLAHDVYLKLYEKWGISIFSNIAVSEQNHIDEVKGIYVPFWLFDADVAADGKYAATMVRTWSDANYHYTETNH